MDQQELREAQAPLKARYRSEPAAALVTLSASGALDSMDVVCSVSTGQALIKAGLHPATGGDGSLACSGDLLLQALVACAGVTLRAVATSLQIPVTGGTVHAEDVETLLKLTERYCVVFQTLAHPAEMTVSARAG